MNNKITVLEAEEEKGAASMSSSCKKENGEAAATTSPASSSPAGDRDLAAREECISSGAGVTTESAVDTTKVEAVPSIRDQILAARKAPEEVAQLIATQAEQLTVPVFKRPPDGAYWRVRSGDDWDPQAVEALLMPRKDGGGGPDFLLVVPELEPLFKSDPRLRNLVHYYHLAFVADTRQRCGWWAVRSRSDNDWHVSARTAMRRLIAEWGMMKSDTAAKGYRLEKPLDDLGQPVWPVGSYEDWLVKGFSDKLLDAEDHPVLMELQGKN